MSAGTNKTRLLVIYGTRPEAIKMAPLVRRLKSCDGFDTRLCVTGQHRHMLDQVHRVFDLVPDLDLNLMRNGQDLTDITTSVLSGLRPVLEDLKPHRVLVHGDTMTTMASCLAAFYQRIPVGHVEAGLRTNNIYAPWPEEVSRQVTSCIADLHFAPTERAKRNLIEESIPPENVVVTGNTVIDALLMCVERLEREPKLKAEIEKRMGFLDPDPAKRLILVTGHRRENFGDGFQRICRALSRLASRPDVQIVYPVHLNPNVREPVLSFLSGHFNVHLLEPLDYLPFVYLMNRAHIIITDSGGVQEEAPSLGKPVLVMRDVTERPEAVGLGNVRLVGTDEDLIWAEANRLLDNASYYERISHVINPYGDGKACDRIMEELKRVHGVQ